MTRLRDLRRPVDVVRDVRDGDQQDWRRCVDADPLNPTKRGVCGSSPDLEPTRRGAPRPTLPRPRSRWLVECVPIPPGAPWQQKAARTPATNRPDLWRRGRLLRRRETLGDAGDREFEARPAAEPVGVL